MPVFFSGFASAESLGRFVGVLEHTALRKQQLAKLDFISSRSNGNQLELSAILTLHFGDFKSQEYVAFHFHSVRYNVLNRTLVFDEVDQDATVVVSSFTGDKLVGTFRSALGGEVGTLKLEREGAEVKPTLPLIERVWGEYKGTCDNEATSLQIYSARSTDDISKSSNPFATYRIKAYRGRFGAHCLSTGTEWCSNGIYDSGEYNFYTNELILYGIPRPLVCVPNGNSLNCEGCILRKASEDLEQPQLLKPLVHADTFTGTVVSEPALTTNAPESLAGEYKGYLHHEYLDRYQPVSVSLMTYQDSSGAGGMTLKMSAVAKIYFGRPGSTEFIAYRFDIRDYPNPLAQMQFVFSRPEADVDANLQVTSLGNGEMKGTWFSQLFGRVGKFALKKSGYPTLPSNAKIMEGIAGQYESSTWDLNLFMRSEATGKTPASTENPFYPRGFDGGFTMKNGATPRLRITGGSYDFYTGRISLEVGERVVVGQRDSQKRLGLRWPTHLVAPLGIFNPAPFRFLGEP